MKEVRLTGGPLTVEEVVAVARGGAKVALEPSAVERIQRGREVVERAVADGRTVYGVTTGFGALADIRIADADLEAMQLSLIRSHAAGVGEPLAEELVKAMMLLRARTLATGYSGVRPEVVSRLVAMLDASIVPVVPEHGSVGASGDLAQLAHLALPLVGEGEAFFSGERMTGDRALAAAGIAPLKLSFKEGLALLNGTEAMCAAACLALSDAMELARFADVACAMTVEACLGSDRPFDARLHEIRPHEGQRVSASNLRSLLAGSEIVASHRDSDHAVQDAYSIRCAPQVHGACRDVLGFAAKTVEVELSSVTDNPVVLVDEDDVRSTGNFHGEPLGFALDFMAAALSELGSISERRTDRLLDPDHSSGLPPFLANAPGKDSGMMLLQYTQASLVVENRILSHPATVDTVPTSGSQEDHVSMGWNAALKLRRVVTNVARILAIEAMCAGQGIDLRGPLKPAPGTGAALDVLRGVSPHLLEDRVLGPEIDDVARRLVLTGDMAGRAADASGGLT